MQKMLALVVTVATTVACFAANGGDTPKKRLSGTQMRAKREARIAAEGGLIQRPSRGKVVRVAFKTDKVSADMFVDVFSEIQRFLSVKIETVGSSEKSNNPTGELIAIIDDSVQPTILVAPEDGWATLNIFKLKSDNPSEALFRTRLHKEFWRTFAFAMGAANAQQQPCLMRPIRSVADLDSHKVAILSPGPMGNVASSMSMSGFARTEFATYSRACEEGWAPAPTNAVQQAIWDKVHAMPSSPMKIEFDPKKGR